MKLFNLLLSIVFVPFLLMSQNSLNLSLIGSLTYNNTECNDIWGYVDDSGSEYALVGLRSGFSVVDLSTPSNPVEVFFISGAQSTWRDIKVWNNYAFVTCDQGSDGLLIVDLNNMTGNPTYVYVTADENGQNMFTRAHNIYIDEFGKGYIFGGNVGPSPGSSDDGALILDLTNVDLSSSNPVLPTILGLFDDFYLHDGMARGDTLWGAAVYEGNFYAIDVSNPALPEIFNNGTAFHPTPNNFTHNCWISDNGKTLFTTDEESGAYIGSYDVSDLNNIYEIDRIQSNPGSQVIPHNTHVLGSFIITSYYRDGITVHDVTYPDNMIEVAYYDMYSGSGDGFDGSWGAYPYLPSGLILSSEINSGPNGEGMLLVLDPSYQQACYLEGNVYDVNGSPISNASIEVLLTNISVNTNLNGYYNTATLNSGSYQVIFSAAGYLSDTLVVNLSNGIITELNDTLNLYVFGCDNPSATNYNPLATTNIGYLGPEDNNFASGGFFYGNQYLLIDIFEDCIIQKAKFYSEYNNTITFELRDQNGIVIDDTTYAVLVGEQDLVLNFDAPIGVGLQLGVSSTNSGLYRNNSGASYPYNLSNIAQITGSSVNSSGYYYFYYDIEVNARCIGVPSDSWDCTPSGCLDPGNGNGQYSSLNDCQLNCQLNSIHDNENLTLIFPNPSSSFIVLKNKFYGEVMIKNLLGSVLISKNKIQESISINIEDLKNGIYFIHFQNELYKFIKD